MSSLRTTTQRIGVALAATAVSALLPMSSHAASKPTGGSSGVKKVPIPLPCPAPETTTVAAGIATKYGAAIKIFKEPNPESQLLYTLGVGIEVKGALVFTVNKAEGDWLFVNVPARPNGATGWIRKAEVKLYEHRYAIRISRKLRRMVVCNNGKTLQTETVAIGNSAKKWDTPVGKFFTVDLLRPRGGANGPYGAFAFGLSGFSENPSLEDFGGGDGRIAIHGTNQPKLLGQEVSHGCIRVSNAGITKMKNTLFLGVPVYIE